MVKHCGDDITIKGGGGLTIMITFADLGGEGVQKGSNIAYVIYEQPLKFMKYILMFYLYIYRAIIIAHPLPKPKMPGPSFAELYLV